MKNNILILLFFLAFYGCYNSFEPSQPKIIPAFVPIISCIEVRHETGILIGYFGASPPSNYYRGPNSPILLGLLCPNPVKSKASINFSNFSHAELIYVYIVKGIFIYDVGNRNFSQGTSIPFQSSDLGAKYILMNGYYSGGVYTIMLECDNLKMSEGFYRIYFETTSEIAWIDFLYDPRGLIFNLN